MSLDMDFETGLHDLARQYQLEGYTVTVRPRREELPPFAADFDVQILATRADENALVLVKRDLADFRASEKAPAQAGITNSQPGWRYDLAILNRTE